MIYLSLIGVQWKGQETSDRKDPLIETLYMKSKNKKIQSNTYNLPYAEIVQ